jgi:hypothetical protein
LSPIVTDASFSRWYAISAPRSMSHSASPEMTRKVSSSRSPLVPSRSRRAERALLHRVLDRHPEVRAVAEVRADRLREERERDHDVGQTVLAQELEDVLDARLADDRHHRLRLVGRQRPKAGALAARHHDGPHAFTSLRAFTT